MEKIMSDREKIIDIIQEVLFAHHDDFSKQDEDACGLAADKIIIMYNLSKRRYKNEDDSA